jgi:DNA repair exonuclease SbcCD ATPase subunit
MEMNATKYRSILQRKKGELSQIERSIEEHKREIKENEIQERRLRKAQNIIQVVAKETQNQLTIHTNQNISHALSCVFEDPYKFNLEFVLRNNKTEADIKFTRDGEVFNPHGETGGGPIVVASFVLRIALWNLKGGSTRNTFLLDEPLIRLKERHEEDKDIGRYCVTEYNKKACLLLKEICKELNIQILMASHTPEVIEAADSVFDVKKNGRTSRIIQIK